MKQPNNRRLIFACQFILLLAAPSMWLGLQYRQVKLDRALIAAIRESDVSKVDALLAAGADPSARDMPESHRSLREMLHDLLHPRPPDFSQTALMKAASYGAPRIVRSLIASGADVNAKDRYGDTALMVAACNADSVNDFGYTREVNLLDESGDTPSIRAAHRRDADNLKALIAAGADVNAKNSDGYGALMFATDCDNYDCANVLIASRADVNAKDNMGYTALTWAEGSEHKSLQLF